ncbi:hypothetical protein BDV24DRAFT_168006 [Aspergillus arachidicola]|uniref:Uncharacterized protein n=1 Tax=Aspergillus arachidicola TaxID=656916 RepID=A0A5N6XU57_9EURO|nr:hypothetical protein BDV24DRAFT_168006 [Aspergillus arachidicola]
MRQIIGTLVLMLMQVLAITSQQLPTSSTTALTFNPTICREIINHEEVSIFGASQAYKCLTSLPFRADIASQLVQYANDMIQFHSTLAYLADPPQSYQQPAVDLVAGLSQLQSDIDNNVFRNEYAFEVALNHLIHAAHDDHLELVGRALSRFTYAAPYSIVSVSSDGVELPKVYISGRYTGKFKIAPSAIRTINGQDIVEYLTQFAAVNSFGKLEPHADWNMLMRSAVLEIQGKREAFHEAATYPGDFITFTFENDTTLGPLPWKASFCCHGGNAPLQMEDDFYDFFVLGHYPASYDESLEANTTTISNRVAPFLAPFENPAYPLEADVTSDGGALLRGYFLNDSSLAVLSIPHFDSNAPQSFSNTVKEFLARSTMAGLKKVVIDVQQNPGGSPLLALEVFKILCPSIKPWASSRRRVHPMANALGSVLTTYWQNLTMDHPENDKLITNRTHQSTFISGTMRLSLPLIFLPLAVLVAGDELSEGNLYDSCFGTTVVQPSGGEKAWVTAHCYKRDGSEFLSHLDLDRCFSWDNETIRPEKKYVESFISKSVVSLSNNHGSVDEEFQRIVMGAVSTSINRNPKRGQIRSVFVAARMSWIMPLLISLGQFITMTVC